MNIDAIADDLIRCFGRNGKLAFHMRASTAFKLHNAIADATEHLPAPEWERAAKQIFNRLWARIRPPCQR